MREVRSVLVCGCLSGFLLVGVAALCGCDGGAGSDTKATGTTESETKSREATEAFYKDKSASKGARK